MLSRPSFRSALTLAALGVFTFWITWRAKTIELRESGADESSALVGQPAPDFSAESLDGSQVSLASYRHKTVALNFWASWCGPCRMEMPVLVKLYRQNHNADSHFEILAVSIDTTRGDAESAARSLKLPFPVLLDPDRHLASSYGVKAIPKTFIIKDGKVTSAHTGFQMGMDFLLAQELEIKNYSPTGGKP
jgi:peroxiredoxin